MLLRTRAVQVPWPLRRVARQAAGSRIVSGRVLAAASCSPTARSPDNVRSARLVAARTWDQIIDLVEAP